MDRLALRISTGLLASLLLLGGSVSAWAQVKITLWHAMGGARFEAITKDIAEEFNKAHPGYVLEPVFAGSYAEVVTKAIAAVRAGNPPHILQVYEVAIQSMLDSGAIIPVSDLIKPGEVKWENYFPQMLGSYRVGEKIYAIPFNLSTAILYYNRDAFKKAGLDPERPPRTYKDVEEMGRQIVRSGAARGAITFGWPGWMFEQAFAQHDQLYAENGNGRAGRATKVLFNNAFGVEVLTRWKRWADEGLLMFGGREYAPNKAFLAGEAAMLLQSTSQVTTIEKAAKFQVGTGFLPVIEGKPRGKAHMGGASLWVLKGKGRSPQELDAIAKFFRFISLPEQGAKWHMETGYFPITLTAEKTLRAQGWFQKHPNHETAFRQIQEGPDTPATRKALLGNFVQIYNLMDTAIEKALTGRLSPQAALDEAVQSADKGLEEYNATVGR